MPFVEILILFLSTLMVFGLIYFKISTTITQQLVATLGVVLIILSRFILNPQKKVLQRSLNLLAIFLSGFLVQLLVISSGGFYSPFLILIHLYTLGVSFLLNLQTAISFLIFSLTLLISAILFDQRISLLFRKDPGSAILYFISFVVIIPLAQLLMRTYHLKDTLSKILTEQIQIGQKRQESILRGLSEIIVLTDSNLHILSVNQSTEKVLGLSENSLAGLFLTDVLSLKDKDGNLANLASLSIPNVLSDKVTRIIKGFYLHTKDGKSQEVLIQIRPVTDSEGKISQIVFVITQARPVGSTSEHFDLEQTIWRYKQTISDLKKVLTLPTSSRPSQQIEILSHIEEDLMTALELEDHPIKEKIVFEDMANLGQQIVSAKAEFANSLGVSLQFSPPGLSNEYWVPIDVRWLRLLIQKLLDLSILLVTKRANGWVQLSVDIEGKSTVWVILTASCPISENQKPDLFTKYYGSLGSLGFLKFGSGLEGFIAATIASRLNIPIEVSLNQTDPSVKFIIKLTKKPPTSLT